MIADPIVSSALVVVLLAFSVYLATGPRRPASGPDVPDNDRPLAETNPSGRDEGERLPALYQGKRSLCI
ncbi:hypothetical protein E0E54_12920 [Azotobacter chroococcum]|jgi:hypothetical protein|uniref:Uncharacterized protein n=2 Tax=Azotobacter chroococcum TaxID=353 RepID=A0A0C4WFX3_9GAMM|nr:hypothetical protein [Azotobacter chroococcum]AJE19723.1 Hypothetical protein Achr_2150 [Azotobacter chroococcum NCIMB 8003]ASL25028.1 hypothetical protein ACG10_01055 [Azotobacter chroococcum]QQE88995.1 hypothetical protein GKQ51_01015 [Azotobacter chroococcum]TBW35018.1 hypothetical protein E0E54_12920 [Azotobacter chroococcum]TKD43870.1 hypothetical protein FCG41_07855 [Azotobacter chroococcum]